MVAAIRQRTAYLSVRADILPGDLALFHRPRSLVSLGDGLTDYSHCGKVDIVRGTVELLEFNERWGSRAVTLSSQVRANPGVIDLFHPKCSRFQAEKSCELMHRQLGKRYAYRNWWQHALAQMPLVRLLFGVRMDFGNLQSSLWNDGKVCSQAVVFCDRAVGFDAVPGLNERLVRPGHLGHSAAYTRYATALTHGEAA